MCTIALLFCSAGTALQCESHHSSFRDFISLSLFFSGEDGDTLVSVSWVVPVTVPDKLHVTRKWRLLALIERMSLFRGVEGSSVFCECYTWPVCANEAVLLLGHNRRCLNRAERERWALCMSKAAKLPCLDLLCSLSHALHIIPPFFPSH